MTLNLTRKIATIGAAIGIATFFALVFTALGMFASTVIENSASPAFIVSALLLCIVAVFFGFFMMLRASRMLQDDNKTRRIQGSSFEKFPSFTKNQSSSDGDDTETTDSESDSIEKPSEKD